MNTDTAAEIVRRAMADRSVYDAMAARENEVWGKILPDRERSEAAIEDMKAGAELRVNRHLSSLSTIARERNLKFEQGLTLEPVAEQVWRSLRSSGYLWIHDFIGETQGQYESKRLTMMNQLLAVLPEKFRKNKITGRFVTEIKRPEPGHLSSPFESIRSSEIVPVFQRWFTIEWKLENSAFLQLVAPPGTRAAYLENEDTKALFEVLMLLDDLCIKEKIVQPTGGQYLMRPRFPNDI